MTRLKVLCTVGLAALLVSVLLVTGPAGGQEPQVSGWIMVTQFGAVGDGQTDDTLAFQQALDTAAQGPQKTVYVPAGTFLVKPGLEIAEGLTLRGDGPAHSRLLIPEGSTGALFSVAGDDVTIRDLALEGVIEDDYLRCIGIHIKSGRDIRVEKLRTRALQAGVNADSLAGGSGGDFAIRNLRVTDSTFVGPGHMGVGLHVCKDAAVDHCYIQGTEWGVSCSTSVGFRCENNTIEDCGGFGLRGLLQCEAHANHNTFRNCGWRDSGAAIAIDTSVNYECVGNLVDNRDVRHPGWGFEWEACSGLVCTGNVLRLSNYAPACGIWLHGRAGTNLTWFLDQGQLHMPSTRAAWAVQFLGQDDELVSDWQIAQPEACSLSSDRRVAIEGHRSLQVEIAAEAQSGLLAVKPLPEDRRRGWDINHMEMAVRGLNQSGAISVRLCRDEEGTDPVYQVPIPGLDWEFKGEINAYQRPQDLPGADAWYLYHLPIYFGGLGYARGGYSDQFEPVASVALYLDGPLEQSESFHLDAVHTPIGDNAYRDAGWIIADNCFYNAFNGVVLGNWFHNVQITDNVFEAKQLPYNRGNAALMLFSFHALVRPEDVARGLAVGEVWGERPENAAPEWVPGNDLVVPNPRAMFHQNVRFSGNIVDTYQQLVAVSGRDEGRFITHEDRLGLILTDNVLTDVDRMLPEGFPECQKISGNVEWGLRP